MRILVVCPNNNEVFRPIAEACYESFMSMGHSTTRAVDYIDGYDLAFFIVFNHTGRIPRHTSTIMVGYHLEQLSWGKSRDRGLQKWVEKFKRRALDYDYIVDCSLKNVVWMHEHGYKALWCALGYHSSFEFVPNKNQLEYPVRFVGFLSTKGIKRREKIINYLNNHLISRQIRVHVDRSYPRFEDIVYGAKIHLNLHNYKQNSWESYRTLRLMCNRQFVLTEPIDDSHPFTNGEHWVESKAETMPRKILYYLDHPDERQQIAENGYQFIREKYNFTIHLQRLLYELTRRKK